MSNENNMDVAVSAERTSTRADAAAPVHQQSEHNSSRRDYPNHLLVHQLFEMQVARRPDATAAIHDEVFLTYAELNQRADIFASQLQSNGVTPGDTVAICCDRGIEMLVAVLAVLKSGGAYVPLDMAFPRDRLAYIAEDSKPVLVMVDRRGRDFLSSGTEASLSGLWQLDLTADATSMRGGTHCVDLSQLLSSTHPAYVLYTSGSTGRPKGVCVSHRSVVNFISSMAREPGLGPDDTICALTTLSFDISVLELLLPLTVGARIAMCDRQTAMDGKALGALLQRVDATVMQATPATWRMLLDAGWEGRPDMRLFCGGEAWGIDLAERLLTRCAQLWNMYGPTETTVWSMLQRVLPGQRRITLDCVVANTTIYLLDEHGALTPPGVAGEIYIGGDGVALGYFGRDDLTAERFLADPFSDTVGARMYRTGDLGRWLSGGVLEYIGRNDFQVKIRGFRIELGEIESQLVACDGVQEAVVTALDDETGGKRLVAYCLSNASLGIEAIREQLSRVLPEYMVPSAFVGLQAWPLTPNGKLDRKALPAPDDTAYLRREYEAPQGETEQQLAAIWIELLKLDRVSRHDNFFELGGHSLHAVQLASRVRNAMAVELPVWTLFEAPVLKRMAEAIAVGDRSIASVIEIAERQSFMPLSLAQQRLWFLTQLDGASAAYHVSRTMKLCGALDVSAISRALQNLLSRHETLRARFVMADGHPMQTLTLDKFMSITEVDLRECSDQSAACFDEIAAFDAKVFDLVHDLPVRVQLLRLEDRLHVLQIVMHHIVSDGWSIGVLLDELSRLYTAEVTGDSVLLPPLPVQYADYAQWQRQWLSEGQWARQSGYWREALSGAPSLLELPTDRPRPSHQVFDGGVHSLHLDAELVSRLKALSRRHGATLYMTLLASWAAVLCRLSGQEEVVIGSPVAGRTRVEVEPLIGFFVNTLALRIDLSGDPTVSALLSQTRRRVLDAQSHQDLPFDQVVEAVKPPRNPAHTPVFQTLLAWQTQDEGQLLLPGIEASEVETVTRTAQFDLTLGLREQSDGIEGVLNYASALFDHETVVRYADYWQRLLSAMANDDMARVSRLPILGNEERVQVLQKWNATQRDYPRDACVGELLAAQAWLRPAATALIWGGEATTYAALNRGANRLAHWLQSQGIGAGSLVALSLSRGPAMIETLLGVLKSGAAYVPMAPDAPESRVSFMLEDARPSLLIADATARLPQSDVPVTVLETLADALALQPDVEPEVPDLHATQLAYVIYTSGTTGTPKGVCVSHRNVVNFCNWCRDTDLLSAGMRMTQFAPYTFDASAGEILAGLLSGAELHLLDDATIQSPDALQDYLEAHQIGFSALPPAYLQQMDPARVPASFKLLTAGSAPTPELVQRWAGRGEYVNGYGPTETTILSTATSLNADEARISIGRPISNTQVYVLDAQCQPVPVGVTGELWIGGDGVTPGYLNREALTAERYQADPFAVEADAAVEDARMYRTGDLGRWLADGSLEFMGRNDFQVKIRGFRIELGEIEARLCEREEIREAVVLAREDGGGEKRLVAYCLSAHALDAAALRERLSRELPEYMVPAAFVRLEAWPLTAHGKIDRKALPAPDDAAYARRAYEAPVGTIEQTLASLWVELLKLEQVGRHDSFFELGGHSLLAVRMGSRVRQALGIELPLRWLFETPVLWQLSERLSQAEATQMSSIEVVARAAHMPLSLAQQRLWFLSQIDGASAAYHSAGALRLKGALDVAALEGALQRIVARHESLRTRFVLVDGHPMQQIAAEAVLTVRHDDLRADPDRDETSRARGAGFFAEPFDLPVDLPLRVLLLQLQDEEYALYVVMHHIASDGWSIGVMLDELSRLYTAQIEGGLDPLPALPIQYIDYAQWQRQWLLGGESERQSGYWRQALSGAPTLLEIPTDRARPPQQDFAGDALDVVLDAELTSRLKMLSQRHGVTLYMTLLASWAAVLCRLSSQDEVVIGSPMAGRTRSEIEPLIGFFVNTLALRIDVGGEVKVSELLSRTRRCVLEAQAHQDLPFDQVVEVVKPARSTSHSPIFQAMLAWQSQDEVQLSMPGVRVEEIGQEATTAQFDLMLDLQERDGGIAGVLIYMTSLFERATMVRYAGYWRRVLEGMVQDEDAAMSSLQLLGEDERERVLRTWNATTRDYPPGQTVHGLFEAQVLRTPAAVALTYEAGDGSDATLSYEELNCLANRWAHHLISLGVRPDDRVAICMERSIDLVVGLLAILKSGAAYVPIDPTYPEDRLQYMLTDSAPKAVLSHGSLSAMIAELAHSADAATTMPVLALDDMQELPECDQNPCVKVMSSHLAYMIYTSGSTGLPKGAMNEHGGAVNRLLWAQEQFALSARDRVLQKTTFGFDVAVWEFFLPLLAGARLVMARPGGHQDPSYLVDIIDRCAITVMHFVPSMLQMFLAQDNLARCHSLRHVKCSGEALPYALQQRFHAELPGVELHNLYGPTEAAVDVTYWRCVNDLYSGIVPIGKPVANTAIYLLDPQGEPVPVGVTGELFISGVQVGRGYLNRTELTEERFVADPFSDRDGARMYRTGDLARWLPDGNVEYLGRNDFQVKIRGFRIELGEIEARLCECDDIREAVVLAREVGDGDKRLVAYITTSSPNTPDAAELRSQLLAHLPDYMVPSAFVALENLPLTPNGKLDRKALPAPDESAYARRSYEAPLGHLEEVLAGFWLDLFKIERVGRYDDFFEIGGHSLLAVQLVSRIRQVLGLELTLRDVFENSALHCMAERLSIIEVSVLTMIEVAPRHAHMPLSPAQQRLWFLTQIDGASAAYHSAGALRLVGLLDRDALNRALQSIVMRHETLRSRFVLIDDQPVQLVTREASFEFCFEDLQSINDPESVCAECIAEFTLKPFSLDAAPPIRVRLMKLDDRIHVLQIVLHHIVSDGWSIGVLLDELGRFYSAEIGVFVDPLPPMPVQYIDYAQWQRQWLDSGQAERQAVYWRDALAGAPTRLELPVDRPRPLHQNFAGDALHVHLDADLTADLKKISQRHGVTLFMTLLASWSAVLGRLSNQDEVLVGSPAAGRNRAEIEPIIGFFVNTLPLRIDLGGEPTTGELLARTRRCVLDSMAHQDLPFDRIVEVVKPSRSTMHSPVFQVMFVLQTQEERRLVMPGIEVVDALVESRTAQFELSLELRETEHGIVGALDFMTALFDRNTVARYLAYWQCLLRGMIGDSDRPVTHLPLLDEVERTRVLETWNDTEFDYPRDTCMHHLFEAQVARTPGALALVSGEVNLTYADLNRRANQLAHHLRSCGVGPDARVGICVERNAGMVVALLATLKSGGAYVPLDPTYPPDRLGHILDDAMPCVVITDHVGSPVLTRALTHAERPQAITILDHDADASCWAEAPDDNPSAATVGLQSSHLGYLIYTSGSTGRPKGVAIEHRNAVNFIMWATREFPPEYLRNVLFSTSINFDLSIFEYCVPLSMGGTVTLVENALTLLNASLPVTLINTVPSAMAELTRADAVPPSVRVVNVAGEVLKRALAEKILCSANVERLCNLYGPSETTTYSTWTTMGRDSGFIGDIGRPVGNTRVYILDAARNPVPAAIPGEIWIGGHGVARGYLGQPVLTAERFVHDPFAAESDMRMYRTGDLGRWNMHGAIELLGRNDFQVKVRGFRIELGEIESRLVDCDGVQEAVVTALDDETGGKRLVAYCLSNASLGIEAIREQLSRVLPEYMVPSAFVGLQAWPLTPNGKLDRKALPAPDDAAYLRREYEAPQGETEQQLAAIWIELLKLDRVSRHDNFFELGGHSLLAVQLVSRARRALDVELPMSALFEAPTLVQLAANLEAARSASTALNMMAGLDPRQGMMPHAERHLGMPLSLAQQRLWFLAQIDDGNAAYHMHGALRLLGDLNLPAFERALHAVVARHEALRTHFVLVDGQPMQQITADVVLDLRTHDLRDSDDRDAAHCTLVDALFSTQFDLEIDPLLRVQVVQMQDRDFVLSVVMHHIVSDGWSIGVLLDELSRLYTAEVTGDSVLLPSLPVQYADYAQWQRQWLSEGQWARQSGYWREALSGAPSLLELPTDRPRPSHQVFDGGVHSLHLDAELVSRLKALSRRHGATLYMTLLASWAAVLCRLSGQEEVVIGSPVAGRTRVEVEPLIGFFVNTLALRIDLSGDPTVSALLSQTRRRVLDAQSHQDLPFDQVVEAVKPPRNPAHTPVFQTLLAWQTQDEGQLLLPGIEASEVETVTRTAQFDLTLGLREQSDGIEGVLNYASALFDHETVVRYADYWQRLLSAMASDDMARVSRLPILGNEERVQVLQKWNATQRDYPRDACVGELLAAQAWLRPAATALIWGGEATTYAALNRGANRLAHWLQSQGIGAGSLVALSLSRGPAMIETLLGVLKSGAAYVPMAPDAPESRVSFMLEDARPSLLIADATARLPQSDVPVAVLETLADALALQPDVEPEVPDLHATQLAYVIYTSGTTGTPKGVCVSHRNVVNFCSWCRDTDLSSAGMRMTQFAPYTFDASAGEILAGLLSGAELHLLDDATIQSPDALQDYLEAHQIGFSALPPAYLQQMDPARVPASFKLLTAGSAPTPELVQRWAGRGEYVNGYGPTETTILSTATSLNADEARISIGRPISNTQVYVLDAQCQPVPVGVTGELWIGGDGVTPGYLNREALTAERYQADPFAVEADAAVEDARMYRTGDLGRWLADGSLEFMGRNDFQVKIRGFRIELGEIEARLCEREEIREAVVLAREDGGGEKRLVAYCLSAHALDAAALRERLSRELPEYMVPAAFVRLEAWPLTAHGKIDRKALPAPDDAAYARRAYEAPVGTIEQTLASLWVELLKLEQVGRHDSFFELGGHSLLAVRMGSRVRQALGIELPLRWLFETPVLWQLSERLSQAEATQMSSIEVVARAAHMPLSLAQQRLWFLSQIDGASAAYHSAGALRLKGALDVAALEGALQRIVARHESLRTRFVLVDGHPMQQIAAEAVLTVRHDDLRADPDRDETSRARGAGFFAEPFDLPVDLPLRVLLLQLQDEEYALYVVMHHIASDGWSIGVMLDELSRLYTAQIEGGLDPLPALPIQYIDYAQWQRQWLLGGESERQSGYWRQALSGAPTLLEIPTDRARPPQQDFAGDALDVVLDAELTSRLKMLSQRHGVTLYMTLLASWAAVLCRLSSQDEVVIGSPMAGRTRSEIEPLIGFFVNTLALRIDVGGEVKVSELLSRTRRCVLEAQAHQDLPFDQVVEVVKPARSTSHSPIFQAMLAWQSQDEVQLSMPGVRVEEIGQEATTAQFDLMLDLQERDGGIAGVLIYMTSLFERATMVRYAGYWRRVLEGMVQDEDAAMSSLQLLGEDERERVLRTWNATTRDYPPGQTVHGLFEAQVLRTPAAVALTYEAGDGSDATLSYEELNCLANRWAHHLISLGVRPDDRVAICMERSIDLVVGLLAILKSGAAYVPIDSGVPHSRLEYLLRDSEPKMLLSHAATRARWATANVQPASDVSCVCLDADAGCISMHPEDNPDAAVVGLTQSHLAYVIYTSGSTGLPKGVMIEHGQLANYLYWAGDAYAVGSQINSVVSSPIAFDATITSLYLPLLSGGHVHLIREGDELEGLERFLCASKIPALVKITPAHLAVIGQRLRTQGLHPAPKLFVVGGEALTAPTVALWRELCPQVRIINEYGPTETVVGCVVHEARDEAVGNVPIGRPIANMAIRILDAKRQPVPMGVVGELYIAGAQVGRGYLNRTELTEDRFVADTFSVNSDARMYRTGDLGRWMHDGKIEYIGRNDFQVKIRGFRIELGEIEAKLAACEGVREVIVLAREDVPGDKRLVAYCLTSDDILNVAALREHLAQELPEYMVPGAFVPVTYWPLTTNGKIDRNALPSPEEAAHGCDTYAAPQGQLEQLLAGIWTELLPVDRVGRDDDFFDIGGHSIMVLLMMDRLTARGLQINLQDVYTLRNVKDIAALIASKSCTSDAEDGLSSASLVNADDGDSQNDALSWLKRHGWTHRMSSVDGRRVLWLSPGSNSEVAALKRILAQCADVARPDRILVVEDPIQMTSAANYPVDANPHLTQAIHTAVVVAQLDASLAHFEEIVQASDIIESYPFSEVQKSGAERRNRDAQHVVPLSGWWSANELRGAFAAVMRSHEMLRAVPDIEGQRWEVIDPAAIRADDIPWVDLRAVAPDAADSALNSVLATLNAARSSSQLCHVSTLISRSDTDHLLAMADDHLISDGRSFEAIREAMHHALLEGTVPSAGSYREFVEDCAATRDPALLDRLAHDIDAVGTAAAMQATVDALARKAALPVCMIIASIPLAPHATAPDQAFDWFRKLVPRLIGLECFGMTMTHHGRLIGDRNYFGQVGLFLDKVPVVIHPTTTLSEAVDRVASLHRSGVRYIDWHRSGDVRIAATLPSTESEVSFNYQQSTGEDFDTSRVDFDALHKKMEDMHGVIFDVHGGAKNLDVLFAFRGTQNEVEEVKSIIESAGGTAQNMAVRGTDDQSASASVQLAGSPTAAGAMAAQTTEAAIVVENLYKRYVDVDVVKGVSFNVPKGSCFGILGPNGAGKTSLLGMIEGIIPITSGRITVMGMDVANQIRHIQPKFGVQLQHSNYFQFLTVQELLKFYLELRAAASNRPKIDWPDRLLERMDLKDKLKSKVDELSGGQKQRLSIALALLADPEILFLDEPSAALDPHSRRHLWEFIEELKQDRNRTIVLTTHYMEEAERLCDEIMIMNQGGIVGRGDPSSLITELHATQQVKIKLEIGAPGEEIARLIEPRYDAVWDAFSDTLQIGTDDVTGAVREIMSITEARGIAMLGIQVDRLSLEDVFLNKTGKELKS